MELSQEKLLQDIIDPARKEIFRQILRKELTPSQKELIELCMIQEMTFTELANIKGLNKSSVCRQYHRALKKIVRITQYTRIYEKELIKAVNNAMERM